MFRSNFRIYKEKPLVQVATKWRKVWTQYRMRYWLAVSMSNVSKALANHFSSPNKYYAHYNLCRGGEPSSGPQAQFMHLFHLSSDSFHHGTTRPSLIKTAAPQLVAEWTVDSQHVSPHLDTYWSGGEHFLSFVNMSPRMNCIHSVWWEAQVDFRGNTASH